MPAPFSFGFSLFLSLAGLGVAGCQQDEGSPSLARIAPSVLEILPNESIRYEIRGCVVEGADRVSSPETGYIEASARARSDSSGTASLALPLTEPSVDPDILLATASVVPGETSTLLVGHYFSGWLAVESADLTETCSNWTTVELAWTDVEGTEALEVAWEAYLLVFLEYQAGITLAIDFREAKP